MVIKTAREMSKKKSGNLNSEPWTSNRTNILFFICSFVKFIFANKYLLLYCLQEKRYKIHTLLKKMKQSKKWQRLNHVNLTLFFEKTNTPYMLFECRLMV